jgi:hypothetical protein
VVFAPVINITGRPVPWLKEAQTLHDQSIGTDEELEFRKKYYVFDEKVEESDFLELNVRINLI